MIYLYMILWYLSGFASMYIVLYSVGGRQFMTRRDLLLCFILGGPSGLVTVALSVSFLVAQALSMFFYKPKNPKWKNFLNKPLYKK
jgi:hypothetical protein